MSKIERNKICIFLEFTQDKDSSGNLFDLKTNIEDGIWFQVDHSDQPEPLRMEHISDGKFWTIQLKLNPFIEDQVSISYRYHFGSFNHPGNWKFIGGEFEIQLQDLKRNNIEFVDSWNDPKQSKITLTPIDQKLANFNIICTKQLEHSENVHQLHAFYLMGPIEEELLTDPAELEKYINEPERRVRSANRMEADPNRPNLWQTRKSIPIQKIEEFGYQLTFLIVKSYYHNRRLSYFKVAGKTNMQVSSEKAEQVQGHVQAQMDIILVVNEQADDPFGLEIVEQSQKVDRWMVIDYDFDRLNHNLEEEPGEVYMVFEKYGKHKLDKINGRWFLQLKILESEWQSVGSNLAYEFQFISKNQVKAYIPPIQQQILEFTDIKPLHYQYLITTNNIITYEQVSKAPPPPPQHYYIETIQSTNVNNVTTINNNIDIQTRPMTQYSNTQFGWSNIQQNSTVRGSQSIENHRNHHDGASFCYTNYYTVPQIHTYNTPQQNRVVVHKQNNIAPYNQWIYYNNIYETYQYQPEFKTIIQVVNNFLTTNTRRISQQNYQEVRNRLIEYKSGKYQFEPEIGVYFMNQVKEIQKQVVSPIKTVMVYPLEDCYKFMENNIKSAEVREKFNNLKEVKKLKPQNQSLDGRQFQLMLLSKKWGLLDKKLPEQKSFEIQINKLFDDLINPISSVAEVKQILGYFLRYCLEKLMIKGITDHPCYQSNISTVLKAALLQQFDTKLEQHPLFQFYMNIMKSDFDFLFNLAARYNIKMMKNPQAPKLEISILKTLMIFASIQSILNERYGLKLYIRTDGCSEFQPYCLETWGQFFFSDIQRLTQLEPFIQPQQTQSKLRSTRI